MYALPFFMGRVLPAGLVGILTAAMIAAFMSTHDSYLLCWSSVITNDIVSPLAGKKLSDRGKVTLTRVLILVIGALIFLISFTFPLKEALWDYMAVTGSIYFSGAFALLVGGLYWRRASSTGAVLALFTGCFAVFGLRGVQEGLLGMTEAQMEVFSGIRVSLGTIALAVVVLVVGSLLFPDKKRTVEGEGA